MTLGLVDAGEKVVVLDNLSTGFAWAVQPPAKLVVGDFGDSALVARLIREHRIDAIAHFAAKIVVPGIGQRPARLLRQQHRQGAKPDPVRRRGRRQAFHLLLDRGGLWRDFGRAGRRGRDAQSDLALRPLEADGRVDAAGREPRLRPALRRAALFQRRRRRSAGAARPVDARTPPISSSAACRRRSAVFPAWMSSARTIRPATAPACATTSRSPT